MLDQVHVEVRPPPDVPVDSTHGLRGEHAVVVAAIVAIAGILLSGPIALAIVAAVHPQPAWQDAASFASHYHPIQLLPYAGGFVLIGGCVALVAGLHVLVPSAHRGRANLALAFTAAFASLILVNYVIQTTFVPALIDQPDHRVLVGALTMSNPRSLAWALEMWGYGVFGVATWAISVAFDRSRLERATSAVYIANGVVSIGGAIATAASPGWLLSTPGFAAFGAWNVLVVVMCGLTIAVMRRRR